MSLPRLPSPSQEAAGVAEEEEMDAVAAQEDHMEEGPS